MKSWLIGRSEDADIRLEDPTVSREHAELIETSPGAYMIVDRGSSGGSWFLRDGAWESLLRARVRPQDSIKLGEYVATVGQLLLSLHVDGPAQVERNPNTGEIIRKGR